jgi:1-acyl-sn-glycerol-3-phosphate acyltransferase
VNWSKSEIPSCLACLRAVRSTCALGGNRSGGQTACLLRQSYEQPRRRGAVGQSALSHQGEDPTVAAKDYWTGNALRRWLADGVFRALLIERRKVTAENNPLREMVAVLDSGESLIIFPEGGRFPGPEPQPFKPGLFHLAKDRPKVELVPVYLENLNRILPKGQILPVPLLGSITVGEPLRLKPGEAKVAFLDRAREAVWSLRLA